MPYAFNTIQFDHVDESNVSFQTPASFTAATIPALTDVFAIGNRVKMTFTIDATGGDTFTNKLLRINPAMFIGAPNNSSLLGNANQSGFESNGVLTVVPTQAVLNAPSPTQNNFDCFMSMNVGATTATIEIYFYVTGDLGRYLGSVPNTVVTNINRLVSTATAGAFNNSNANTVYRQTRNLGITAIVFDYVNPNVQVLTPGGTPYLNIPVQCRWYNSDYTGTTTGMRYIKEIEITSPSQIAAGLNPLTDATATGAQAGTSADVRGIFTVLGNQLSVNEMNSVRILFRGDSYVGSANNSPISDVRVMLFRVDDIQNTADFVAEYDLSDAKILPAVVASAQIDNAIWSPCDWFENVPAADDVEVQFMIDGNELALNGRYYIAVNLYDSVNEEYVTAHLSPELIASYTSPAVPTITGYLSVYNKEYSGNELTVSPHQRIKASIEIDKTSYETALAAMGITADFDDCLFGIIAKLQNVTGVVNQVQSYIPNTLTPPANNQVLTPDLSIVTNTVTTLRLEAIFRIAEEYAGVNTNVTWTLSFNQPIGSGQTDFIQINYVQKLSVKVFENDAVGPELLAVRFYDLDLYLAGTKREITELCNVEQIICEVEKDPTFTGSINLVATIYPASETGDTNTAAIEEEEDWAPLVVQMSQAVSGKLDSVETSFGGDDFATFRINCQQLAQNQRYWITAIAFEQFPTYCPLGLISVIGGSTNWNGTAFGWSWVADPTALINEIIAHPDYVGGVTVVQNRAVDNNGNLVGNLNFYTGNALTVYQINTALTQFFYEVVIDAVFNSGTANHTVRHTLFTPILRPAFMSTVGYLMSGYECTDLG